MAREVHDTVAKGLVSVLLQLRSAEAALAAGASASSAPRSARPARRRASRSRRRAAACSGSRPRPLEGRSLEEALERELAWANRTGAADVRLVVAGEPVPLPTEVAHSLFRIAQEALTNALHHADARSVRIGIVYAPDGGHACSCRTTAAGFDLAEVEQAGRAARDRPARDGRAGPPARAARWRWSRRPGWGTRVRAPACRAPATAPGDPGRRARAAAARRRPRGDPDRHRAPAGRRRAVDRGRRAGGVGPRRPLVLWRALRPDVALMDLRMPDGDGVEAIVAIRARGPRGGDRRADGLRPRRARRGRPARRRARLPRQGRVAAPSSPARCSPRPTAAPCSRATRWTASRPTSTARPPLSEPRAARSSACSSAACPDRQIADALSISVKTVEKHVGAILRKTGAQNRTEAALRARERALR